MPQEKMKERKKTEDTTDEDASAEDIFQPLQAKTRRLKTEGARSRKANPRPEWVN